MFLLGYSFEGRTVLEKTLAGRPFLQEGNYLKEKYESLKCKHCLENIYIYTYIYIYIYKK